MWERIWIREKVIDIIRKFFKDQGFHEMFTPILVATPSAEPNLEVFETQLRTASGKKSRAFLILSPEYSLKKAVAAGSGSVFEITKCFRNNEEVSSLHNPEFTMLEWYRIGADYKDIMNDFENLFLKITGGTGYQGNRGDWGYRGEKYDVSLPWPRISVADAFEKYTGIEIETLLDEKKLITIGEKKGYDVKDTNWEQMFYQIFFNEIEPALKKSGRPAFVYDYPLSQAALARRKKSDPRFAERFEVYLAGLELGNCFSELTDPVEQRSRLEADIAARRENNKTPYSIDEKFIEALEFGMPEMAGIAVGVDRLVMLASNSESIGETLFLG
ncbi:MAG: Uncharacterized protein G01um101416_427 [Microgenomates group bacterium Gr01-1014_16]|nr:MAG: Uncharacterized protein G01um101416_427 [Microgenomates group bacterium Gr01-1014_16]